MNTKKKIKKITLFFALCTLMYGCSGDTDSLQSEVNQTGQGEVQENIALNPEKTTMLKSNSDSIVRYKLIASGKNRENTLFVELSSGRPGTLTEGTYDFHTGKPEGNVPGIIYGMVLPDNGKPTGITGGSVVLKEGKAGKYEATLRLDTENGKKLDETLYIDGIAEEKKHGSAKVEAASTCAGCTDNFQTWVSEAEARSWAARYAPYVKFDQAASTYPDDIEVIWNASTNRDCGQQLVLSDQSIIENRNTGFTTYFDVQISPDDSRRVFIDYWWAYARQPNCIGDTGGHDYDWEHVVIQFNRNTWTPSTITFFQHGGWYTQNLTTNRDEVYVGKVAHGAYHDSGGIGGCLYYADYRNPGITVDIANNLYQLRCSDPILSADVNWGRPGKSPLWRARDYWNFAPCKGDNPLGTHGCARGDYKDTALGGIERSF